MFLSQLSRYRLLRWILRFRKRCGYGIHSPFAFNLVTGVIYENDNYYCYDVLLKRYADQQDFFRLKDKRLLFRLVNDHQPSTGLLLGDCGVQIEDYIKLGCSKCSWTTIPLSKLDYNCSDFTSNPFDFIFLSHHSVSEPLLTSLLSHVTDRSLWVISGIHKNDRILICWRHLLQRNAVRVSFDLYDFGLVYFERRLNKENYVINYY